MKGLRIIANIFVAVLALALVALAFSQLLGVRYFSVLSGSMEPEIPTGSLVVAVPESLTREALQPGDVISYVADENLTVVTHRIVETDPVNNVVTTKGDANEADDPPVLMANVVGKVVYSIPHVGYPLMYLSTLTGKIIAVTVAVVICLLAVLVNLISHKKGKRRLVITYDDESSLTPETFSLIAEGIQQKTGGKKQK